MIKLLICLVILSIATIPGLSHVPTKSTPPISWFYDTHSTSNSPLQVKSPFQNEQTSSQEQAKSQFSKRKSCVDSCRNFIGKTESNLHYCVEGCRIKSTKRIYECVYEKCNDLGNGIPKDTSKEQYNDCVQNCKSIRKRTNQSTKSTTTTTSATNDDLVDDVNIVPITSNF